MVSLYRAVLVLYPDAYRREYGADMVETFKQRVADQEEQRAATRCGRERLGRTRFLARELWGVVVGSASERFGRRMWARRAGRAGGDPAPSRPGSSSRGAMLRELRYATRRLGRTPGFAAAAILTLAVGIGGTTSIFAVLRGVVLEPLPYPDSDRLVRVAADVEAIDAHGIEIPVSFWLGFSELNRTFDEIALYDWASVNLAGDGTPERLEAIRSSGSLFPTLAVAPLWGRALVEADETPGAPPVAVLSHSLWARRYGADPGIVGRKLRIDDVETEVVGVMPKGFAFPRPETQLWLPLTVDRSVDPQITFTYSSIGRLRDGATLDAARQDLEGATPRLPELFGNITTGFLEEYGVSPALEGYKETVLGDVGATLWLLLGALGLVLLMACANVANLFLVRFETRRQEVGLRSALGAGRADLGRHLLAEGLVLGLLAGGFGLLLAAGGVRLLVAFGPADVPRLHEVGISHAELALAVVLSLLASVAFGALPFVRLGRERPLSQLPVGGRGEAASRQGVTRVLVVCQVSLALMLLVGAVLFLVSLAHLLRIDPGFGAERVLTFRLSLSESAFPDRARQALFHQQLLDRLEALPEVEAAGLARCLPLQGWCGGNPVMSPDTTVPPETFRHVASLKPVSAGYFRALGIPLVSGRVIERRDCEARTGAAVLSEALAARLFPEMDPIGRRVYPNEEGTTDGDAWYRVVGVVGTVKRESLDEEPADILYLPLLGTDDLYLPGLGEVTVAVRTLGDPIAAAPRIRAAVRELAPEIPIAALEPMREILSRASARVELTAVLIAIAACGALLLGAVGIYGVVSHAVAQRTSEFGLRIALGARPLEVTRMVIGQGVAVAIAGVALGLAGALAVAKVLRSLLYEISPHDPLVLLLVATALVAVAAVASYLPARRAARVDPMIALRRE